MLEQPLLTEEGHLNEACMNELAAALDSFPPDHIRLSGDPEWTKKHWIFASEILGAFAQWSVRQFQPHEPQELVEAFPPNLESVLGYLHACLKVEFDKLETALDPPLVQLSLCDISKMLHEILWDLDFFQEWNREEIVGPQWMGLDALLRNVCITIRNERREDARFDAEFEAEHGHPICERGTE